MNKKPKPPICCTHCGDEHTCSCKFAGGTIDYKLRTGICKKCYAEGVTGEGKQ